MRLISWVSGIVLLFMVVGCQHTSVVETRNDIEAVEVIVAEEITGEILKVHFIDIGQGDAILIEGSQGEYCLIDTGKEANYSDLKIYIDNLGIEIFKYLIGTHPDEDHIGSIERIIEDYTVETVIMPDVEVDKGSYWYAMNSIINNDIPLIYPELYQEFILSDAILTVIGPMSDWYEDINNYSLVIRMVYGDTSFLLTGDAEAISEYELVDFEMPLKSDVLKVGHHGSYSASTEEFLNAVKPTICVISCGIDNDYGYPHDVVLKRLTAADVKEVYRTDLQGDIIIISDGNNLLVQTSAMQ